MVAAAAVSPPLWPPAAAAADGAAVDAPLPGWTVVHCGTARGVLYLTYTENGRAGITPAFATAAVAKACAAAGHALQASAPARGTALPARPAATAAPAPPAAVRTRIQPTFTPQALGSTLTIDARNDGDAAWRCELSFAYTFDDDTAGPRPGSAQATLPPHQSQRIVSIAGPWRNVRFVGWPRWRCNAE